MKINIPHEAQKIIEILKANAHDSYVVGGCVRDTLLGRRPGDWDITTDAKPREIKKLFRYTIDTGIEHGTVTVLMKGKPYEVTTYRVDGDYSDHRRPDSVRFSDSLTEDLKRRDFTINAMAYNPDKGLVDEFDGLGDLERRLIRCVGLADERFDEDALRILRATRFSAQLGFEIEQKTREAIPGHASDLKAVSAERILVELGKTISSDHPEKLRLIWDLGLAPHICDSFTLIRDASGLIPGRKGSWASLMRDLSGEDAKKILKELKADNDTVRKTVALVDEYKLPLPRTEAEIRRTLSHIGPELFDELMEMKEAPAEVSALKQMIIDRGDAYTIAMLAVGGNDLMQAGIRQGPGLGRTLGILLERVIDNPEQNSKEALLADIMDIK